MEIIAADIKSVPVLELSRGPAHLIRTPEESSLPMLCPPSPPAAVLFSCSSAALPRSHQREGLASGPTSKNVILVLLVRRGANLDETREALILDELVHQVLILLEQREEQACERAVP